MSVKTKDSSKFAAAYIRVSTDEQAELSPESQLEEIKKYAQREGFILLQKQIYIDEGISGKKAERRPEFMRMIATAKEKDCPFSTILLWKFSRFARNQEESIFYSALHMRHRRHKHNRTSDCRAFWLSDRTYHRMDGRVLLHPPQSRGKTQYEGKRRTGQASSGSVLWIQSGKWRFGSK